MPKYSTQDIRNLAIAGHGASGKTMLVESLLFKAKAISRKGSVSDGTTVSDFEQVEKEHKHSIDLAVTHLTWKGKEIQVLDTPGYPDFLGDAAAAIASVGAVLVAVDASAGVKVNTRAVWSIAEKRKLPRAIVVTRADLEHAKWQERLEDIKANFGEKCTPIVMPKGGVVGTKMSGVDLVYPLPANASEELKAFDKRLVEVAVEGDEALMMRYLDGDEIKPDEVKKALHAAFRAGSIYPIFVTSSEKDFGIEELLTTLVELFPYAGERTYPALDADSGKPVEVSADKPFTAQVFKVVYDPFVGKLSYFRVYSGTLPQNATVIAPSAKAPVKIAHIYKPQGKETKEVPEAIAGDIVVTAKVEDLHPGDTICTGDFRVKFPPIDYPTPMVGLAVSPKARDDESKLAPALQKLVEADPTLKQTRHPQTHELVVTGMSELHLQVLFARLKNRYKVEVTTKIPKVAYLETITTKGDAKYRHKKQTGGAGQFAEVWLRIEPQPRGDGFAFESEVVGGAISQSFIPSIEKGVKYMMERGVIAGYPVVDLKAVVYDGKEHPVDSKDIAFQIAGRMAFREAVKQAKPVLIEPVVDAEITVPIDSVGSIMSDLPSRRGRVTTQDQAGNYAIVKAKVPLAEMQTYSSGLRSMTAGEGSFTMAFSHYDPVPSNIAQQVIAQFKDDVKHDE
ncbi:MAG TPA: elongation factor G [Planctomycetota bacterium]|nr:elongation factor G [Planctomycetota bacterium]